MLRPDDSPTPNKARFPRARRGLLNDLVHGDNSLRNEVNTLYLRGRGNIPRSRNSSSVRAAFRDMPLRWMAVVPPHTMCFPSLEKKSDIILSQSSRLRGGPKSMFIGSRRRILTTHAVASCLPAYTDTACRTRPQAWLRASLRYTRAA